MNVPTIFSITSKIKLNYILNQKLSKVSKQIPDLTLIMYYNGYLQNLTWNQALQSVKGGGRGSGAFTHRFFFSSWCFNPFFAISPQMWGLVAGQKSNYLLDLLCWWWKMLLIIKPGSTYLHWCKIYGIRSWWTNSTKHPGISKWHFAKQLIFYKVF